MFTHAVTSCILTPFNYRFVRIEIQPHIEFVDDAISICNHTTVHARLTFIVEVKAVCRVCSVSTVQVRSVANWNLPKASVSTTER